MNRDRYIGAVQYEGSNNYHVKEPHIVSFRFKRSNLPSDLKSELESITSLRRDKNSGPTINPDAESIAFKFEELNDHAREVISNILSEIKEYKLK